MSGLFPNKFDDAEHIPAFIAGRRPKYSGVIFSGNPVALNASALSSFVN